MRVLRRQLAWIPDALEDPLVLAVLVEQEDADVEVAICLTITGPARVAALHRLARRHPEFAARLLHKLLQMADGWRAFREATDNGPGEFHPGAEETA